MNHINRGKRVWALMLAFVLTYNVAGAQQEVAQQYRPPAPTIPVLPTVQPRPEGTFDCFDFYTFGSMDVDVVAEPRETLTGLPVNFRGVLKNNNPYPVVDAQVYMKVYYKDDATSSFVKQNGHPLVDFVLVADTLSVPAKGSAPLLFSWDAPQFASAGEYTVSFFVTSANRSNLLGLTFTDDVVGNTFPIVLKALGTEGDPVRFDKNAVTLNTVPYRFASYPPHFGKNEGVTIASVVENPRKETATVNVVWLTSIWDGLRDTSVLDRKVTTVVLAPGERKEISYTPPTTGSAVTFVQGELTYKDTKSLLHVRYVRDGVEEVRMNFPAVSSYPLTAGDEVSLFSCLHSTNMPVVKGGSLVLSLTDVQGKDIHTYTYEGDVTSAMMGLRESFVPPRDIADFNLTATLKHGGKTIDSVTLEYRCADIDPTVCPKVSEASTMTPTRDMSVWYILVPLLVLLLSGGLLLYRARKPKQVEVTPNS